MDPTEGLRALHALGTATRGFVERLAGPAAEEIGFMLQEMVRKRRFERELRMLEELKSMCDEAGIEPTKVPLKTLVPLLEGASLEEDDDLQKRWAALLANAADPREERETHPSFAHMLSQMSAIDTAVLDVLYDAQKAREAESSDEPALPLEFRNAWWEDSIAEVVSTRLQQPVSEKSVRLSFAHLARLGLCVAPATGSASKIGGALGAPWVEVKIEPGGPSRVYLSVLGESFVEACRPPDPVAEKEEES